MFNSSFVLSVKNNNKEILREFGNRVYLPFYSEFSLLLKNLRSQRAVVSVKIDGMSILGDGKLVIGPNDSLDLERFLNDGDFLKGNKFKFVPVEGNAADPSSSENGWVEVRVQFESTCMTTGMYVPPTWSVPQFISYPLISIPLQPVSYTHLTLPTTR
jgi:hypothetical protein